MSLGSNEGVHPTVMRETTSLGAFATEDNNSGYNVMRYLIGEPFMDRYPNTAITTNGCFFPVVMRDEDGQASKVYPGVMVYSNCPVSVSINDHYVNGFKPMDKVGNKKDGNRTLVPNADTPYERLGDTGLYSNIQMFQHLENYDFLPPVYRPDCYLTMFVLFSPTAPHTMRNLNGTSWQLAAYAAVAGWPSYFYTGSITRNQPTPGYKLTNFTRKMELSTSKSTPMVTIADQAPRAGSYTMLSGIMGGAMDRPAHITGSNVGSLSAAFTSTTFVFASILRKESQDISKNDELFSRNWVQELPGALNTEFANMPTLKANLRPPQFTDLRSVTAWMDEVVAKLTPTQQEAEAMGADKRLVCANILTSLKDKAITWNAQADISPAKRPTYNTKLMVSTLLGQLQSVASMVVPDMGKMEDITRYTNSDMTPAVIQDFQKRRENFSIGGQDHLKKAGMAKGDLKKARANFAKNVFAQRMAEMHNVAVPQQHMPMLIAPAPPRHQQSRQKRDREGDPILEQPAPAPEPRNNRRDKDNRKRDREAAASGNIGLTRSSAHADSSTIADAMLDLLRSSN